MVEFAISNFTVFQKDGDRRRATFTITTDQVIMNECQIIEMGHVPNCISVYSPKTRGSSFLKAYVMQPALFEKVREAVCAIYSDRTGQAFTLLPLAGEGAPTASETRQSARDPWLNETLTRAGI